MKLLIIIPAYNEELRLGKTLDEYVAHFSGSESLASILVVVNGSRDRTSEVAKEFATKHETIRVVVFGEPIGKGGALIEGLRLVGDADRVAYVDADGATGPEEIERLATYCGGADAVVASRWLPGAEVLVEQGLRRRFLSRCFNGIVRLLFGLPYRDTQCGAKVMRSEWVGKIADELIVTDMAFDVNWIVALRRKGAHVIEVPTVWRDREGSKVKVFRTSFLMLISVIRLRWIYSPLRCLRRPFQPIESKIYEWLSR